MLETADLMPAPNTAIFVGAVSNLFCPKTSDINPYVNYCVEEVGEEKITSSKELNSTPIFLRKTPNVQSPWEICKMLSKWFILLGVGVNDCPPFLL
jgi:hypothetical protein